MKEIIEYTGSKSSVYYAPYRRNESNSTRILLDISKAQKVLEYNPIISFKDGLERTAVSWLKENPDGINDHIDLDIEHFLMLI